MSGLGARVSPAFVLSEVSWFSYMAFGGGWVSFKEINKAVSFIS